MNKFKVGDRVRRTKNGDYGLVKFGGESSIITSIN